MRCIATHSYSILVRTLSSSKAFWLIYTNRARTSDTGIRAEEKTMRILRRIAPAVFGVVAVVALATALVTASPVPSTAANKTYDLWVVANFNEPGTVPFHDCARFTANQMCLEQCGNACGVLREKPLVPGQSGTFWLGTVPCNGLSLQFVGTTLDGINGVGTLGGSGHSTGSEANNYGVSGAQNAACTLAPATSGRNPYKRAE